MYTNANYLAKNMLV